MKTPTVVPPEIENMVLYAWVGEDELGSGEYGLKHAHTPVGLVPLVACKTGKMDQRYIEEQLRAMRDVYGKQIRLLRFKFDGVEKEL